MHHIAQISRAVFAIKFQMADTVIDFQFCSFRKQQPRSRLVKERLWNINTQNMKKFKHLAKYSEISNYRTLQLVGIFDQQTLYFSPTTVKVL